MVGRPAPGRAVRLRAPTAPHDLRIVWRAAGVDYYLDDVLRASHPVALADPMYVYASSNGAGGALALDWLRVESYAGGAAADLSTVKDVGLAMAGVVS